MDPVFGPGSEKWGIKYKKQSKIAFFQNFQSRIFSKFFFDENVAQEPAQLLAETWCPYLLLVLRNLPHKFEKLAHVTKSAKKKRHHMGTSQSSIPKNVTIWAPRKTRAPNILVNVMVEHNLVNGAVQKHHI